MYSILARDQLMQRGPLKCQLSFHTSLPWGGVRFPFCALPNVCLVVQCGHLHVSRCRSPFPIMVPKVVVVESLLHQSPGRTDLSKVRNDAFCPGFGAPNAYRV